MAGTIGQVNRRDAGPMILSACLAGVECKYNGTSAGAMEKSVDADVLLVCPESLGGLPTPRARAEIVGGDGFDVLDGRARVMTCEGDDVTDEYLQGARQTLEIAERAGVRLAVLQEFSPSCGRNMVSDGSFTRNRVAGVGVTTALLMRNGIEVRGQRTSVDSAVDSDGRVDLDLLD